MHAKLDNVYDCEKVSFKIVSKDILRKEITNLDGAKVTPNSDISVNILKSFVDIHLPYIKNIINLSTKKVIFPMNLSLQKLTQFSNTKMT